MNSIDKLCINTIRVLSAEAVQKASSGHPGMPIGAAPIGYTVFNKMRINPKNPDWEGRDRFILAAGHASMLLYSLLHINGYDVSIEDIKNFRQLGSKTPGHPEYKHTPGVEATTGPLGQGFAMAVGMAMAEAHKAAIFNREGFDIVNNYTYVLMSDGCMMEGVSSEAASLAGTLGLHKLIAIYDSNSISIEGDTDQAFLEDVGKRYEAYGFNVIKVSDGEDIDKISKAIDKAKSQKKKPTLIIVRTNIAHGTEKQGKASAHGEPLGEEVLSDMKARLGWNYEPFTVPSEVYEHYEKLQVIREQYEQEHKKLFEEYKKAYPELAEQYELWHSEVSEEAIQKLIDLINVPQAKGEATRSISGAILNMLYNELDMKNLFGGSADLGPSNKTIISPKDFISKADFAPQNIHFGVREFAMAAACNGIALYGGFIPFCATFLVFSDYLKPALRLSALMGLRVLYILTHDSIGVGEDGPTHQPIEHLTALRATPNVLVFRPADYKETVAAYESALKASCPSVLALSRQNLPTYEITSEKAMYGGYIASDCENPECIIIASGSELEIAQQAHEELKQQGINTRLVSMPCMELFDKQSEEYRESVLPKAITSRVAVEAGSSVSWYKYIGLNGEAVTMDTFGTSAPAKQVYEYFGITKDRVIESVKRAIEKNKQ